MSAVWNEALPKLEALIAEHKRGAHSGRPVVACVSCLFTSNQPEARHQ